jgi:uncharacterized protein
MRVGTVASLWRYPVKSMRGEQVTSAFMGFAGIYGDRIFAFTSTASPPGFPYLTGRTQQAMLQYQPRFREAELAARPASFAAAEQISAGSNLTLVYADPASLGVEVRTPAGELLAIDDEALISLLGVGIDAANNIALVKSQRALTDCRPASLFSMQTAHQLQQEMGVPVDHRRFRANIFMDLESGIGFAEDAWVGRSVRIGPQVTIRIVKRDGRCKMITLDPDTGAANPAFFKQVQQAHGGTAGVYGAVLAEGMLHQGDIIELLD